MPAVMFGTPLPESGHGIESEVRRELLSVEGVTVSSLVVRRIPGGICLQGVLRFADESVDICDAVRRIPGIGSILDHTVKCTDDPSRCMDDDVLPMNTDE